MKVREARLTDLKNLSVLFNSYRMFYGKKSDLKVAEEFLRSRIEKKDSKIFVDPNLLLAQVCMKKYKSLK